MFESKDLVALDSKACLSVFVRERLSSIGGALRRWLERYRVQDFHRVRPGLMEPDQIFV